MEGLIKIEPKKKSKEEEPINIDFEATMANPEQHIKLEHLKREIEDQLLESRRERYPCPLILEQLSGLTMDLDEGEEFDIINHPKDESLISEFESEFEAIMEHPAKVEMEPPTVRIDDSPTRHQEEFSSILEMQPMTESRPMQSPRESGIVDGIPRRIEEGLRFCCDICDEKLENSFELTRHTNLHKNKKCYSCIRCGEEFKNKSCMIKHSRSRMCKKFWPCHVCDKSYTNDRSLYRHLETHSAKKVYICDVCGRTYTVRESFIKHIKRHKSERRVEKFLPCQICKKNFSFEYKLRQHMSQSHRGEKLFWCADCGKGFVDKTRMRKHVQSHAIGLFKCKICGERFDRLGRLRIHTRSHAVEKPFTCEICSKSFISKERLACHMKIHIDERPPPCSFCNKRLKSKELLKYHMLIHTKEKPYPCKICGEKFRDPSAVIKHSKRKHGPRDIFPCNLCDKSYSSTRSLNAHLIWHTGERPFLCKICGKSFYMKLIFEAHVKTHEREKLKCKICGKAIKDEKSLIEHEESHKDEDRPFVCDHCGCRFFQKWRLEKHILTHFDARPLECKVCDKRFKRTDILKAHMRTHTGERPFPCKFCSSRFKDIRTATRHAKVEHPEKLRIGSISSDVSKRELRVVLIRCEVLSKSELNRVSMSVTADPSFVEPTNPNNR